MYFVLENMSITETDNYLILEAQQNIKQVKKLLKRCQELIEELKTTER
jgi:hypothetical protein